MRRLLATLCFTIAVGVAAGSLAAAGGWAVSTLDQVPDRFVAGVAYDIGWTIRQHGVEPIDVAAFGGTTAIRVRSGSETRSFTGTRSGVLGHYVTRVTFPSSGEWTWEVQQGPFMAQQLGSVTVHGAGAAPAGTPVSIAPVPSRQPWSLLLPLGASLSAALFAGLLALYLRGAPRATRAA